MILSTNVLWFVVRLAIAMNRLHYAGVYPSMSSSLLVILMDVNPWVRPAATAKLLHYGVYFLPPGIVTMVFGPLGEFSKLR